MTIIGKTVENTLKLFYLLNFQQVCTQESFQSSIEVKLPARNTGETSASIRESFMGHLPSHKTIVFINFTQTY